MSEIAPVEYRAQLPPSINFGAVIINIINMRNNSGEINQAPEQSMDLQSKLEHKCQEVYDSIKWMTELSMINKEQLEEFHTDIKAILGAALNRDVVEFEQKMTRLL